MKRIVVSGYYGAKNAGDEAMLAAMLEVLGDLDPELHITVISADPADTRRRHGVAPISSSAAAGASCRTSRVGAVCTTTWR